MKSAARRCVCIIGCVLMVAGACAETPPAEVVTFDHWAYDLLQILSDTQVSSWEPRPWGGPRAFTRYVFAEMVAVVLRDMSSSGQAVSSTPPRLLHTPGYLSRYGLRGNAGELVESVPNIIATMVREFWPELATLDREAPKLRVVGGGEVHVDQVRIVEARTPRESLMNVPARHWFHAQAQQLLQEIATDDNNVPVRVR